MNKDVKSEDINIMVKNLMDYVGGTSSSSSPSIHRAPSNLLSQSPSSFKPRVVSIGPLHRTCKKLQRFERRKAEYVKSLLDNTANETGQSLTQILTACVEKLTSSTKEIERWYGYAINEEHGFAEMMIKDACFILQFILEIESLVDYWLFKFLDWFQSSDLFQSRDMFMSLDDYVYHDLLLLENQIPFFVLNDIYKCTIFQFAEHQSLTQFILPFIRKIVPVTSSSYTDTSSSHTKYDHILGYLHDCYKPRINIEPRFPKSTIRSAVELERAGVKLIPNKNADWPLAINVEMRRCWFIFSFLSEPTLKMPALRINHFTEVVFRNLIAYEQSSGVPSYVTSYVRTMDMLVDTDEDIAVLVRSKVIINHLGSNEEAANMINGICKEGVWEYFFYGDEWEKMDTHFTGYWSRKLVNLHLWMDNFRRTYFSSPWNIIALFAGIALFGLTVVQTIFTVKYAGK